MDKKIEVLGIQIDHLFGRELKTKATGFLYDNAMHTILMLGVELMTLAGTDEQLKSMIEHMDLCVIGEKEILDAAGIKEWRKQTEVGEHQFLREFLKFTARRDYKIFVLAENKKELESYESILMKNFSDITLCGSFAMDQCIEDEDKAINAINSAAPDVIVSCLKPGRQERFLFDNKNKFLARVWLGAGHFLNFGEKTKFSFGKWRKVLDKFFFKREVSRYEKKEENMSDRQV